jgi:hypothetical protein
MLRLAFTSPERARNCRAQAYMPGLQPCAMFCVSSAPFKEEFIHGRA